MKSQKHMKEWRLLRKETCYLPHSSSLDNSLVPIFLPPMMILGMWDILCQSRPPSLHRSFNSWEMPDSSNFVRELGSPSFGNDWRLRHPVRDNSRRVERLRIDGRYCSFLQPKKPNDWREVRCWNHSSCSVVKLVISSILISTFSIDARFCIWIHSLLTLISWCSWAKRFLFHEGSYKMLLCFVYGFLSHEMADTVVPSN